MSHKLSLFAVLLAVIALSFASRSQAEINGAYIEARTCQVYTGPCFANGEVGLAGKEAVMAWNIQQGAHQGVDLKGLNVVMVIKSNETIGFRGIKSAENLRATLMVDERANVQQRDALADFARGHVGLAKEQLVRVEAMPIDVKLDTTSLNGAVTAGSAVKLSTRKARKDDCICSNESAYYPPIVTLENFVPGVTIDGCVRARGLGSRWEVTGDRNVYMATFRQ